MTQWANGPPRSPAHSPPSPSSPSAPLHQDFPQKNGSSADVSSAKPRPSEDGTGVTPRPRASSRPASRRDSLAQAYQPPVMEINEDTPAELQPIFTYLNSHSNKLYQEGYFLKLHDLDSRGRPSTDRIWNECFAQLVGTVLSLWDAAQLDAAGEDGEVIPTFINLTDASIKMIESLPMNGVDGQSLQNVLSISTAANNRYLLHFNSLHSLTQWTAGIRLAMYEHATLQEAYTGSILAGKGKHLNDIRTIMERSRFPVEDWARVRFGAGTPWRRCWCVITPPSEKDIAKAQKAVKKKSAYDRTVPIAKGDIKFYDTRKVTKKTKPIATVTDAFSAYALYPQSKALIDASTLIKVEGQITIHSKQESSTEGFIFVMPEVHPAISGFEIMLRWLMPAFDTFALYGRPTKLVADVLDVRSLMFGMPTNRRYGYLELIDVAGVIHTEGSSRWGEREWRKQMKNLTSKRMTSQPTGAPARAGTDIANDRKSRSSLNLPNSASRSSLNLGGSNRGIRFGEQPTGSAPGSRRQSPGPDGRYAPPNRTDSAPPIGNAFGSPHKRAVSEARAYPRNNEPSPLPYARGQDNGLAPPPPPHGGVSPPSRDGSDRDYLDEQWHSADEGPYSDHGSTPDRIVAQSYQSGYSPQPPIDHLRNEYQPVNPVQAPPTMAHKSGQRPPVRPSQMPEMRRANSAVDAATLAQMRDANPAARNVRGSRDDSQMYMQRPPQGGGFMNSAGGPNYSGNYSPGGSNVQSNNGYVPYGSPYGPNTGAPPPQRRMQQQQNPSTRTLPTIPGTPAQQDQDPFNNSMNPNAMPLLQKQPSESSVRRKPITR
ncbi:MAG: hypothetical protein M1828_005346 [Chrysothrix sp. TS-e1954]|nr:MAG: hypothetical protein M1828_005346 [Chrysothrix sp. TS-e1954]